MPEQKPTCKSQRSRKTRKTTLPTTYHCQKTGYIPILSFADGEVLKLENLKDGSH
jgi:hypothetical protein